MEKDIETCFDDLKIETGLPKTQNVFNLNSMIQFGVGKHFTVRWEQNGKITLDALIEKLLGNENITSVMFSIKLIGLKCEYTAFITFKNDLFIDVSNFFLVFIK